MQSTERLEKVNIDTLVPYARNARTHSKEQILQLRSSLREYGFVNPVLCDKDFNIIAGHGRVLAAKAEGFFEVPCVFVEHLTEAQKRAYILADNRLALSAGWDEELLALEFAELKDLGFDLELTGFDMKEVEALFSPELKTAQDDDFDEDTAVKAVEEAGGAVTRRGDIWMLGAHRLMCGDSTSEEDFAVLMDGKKAQMCVTSPPYGVGKEYEEKGIDAWFATMRPAIKNICRYAGTVCYNIGDLFATGSQFIEPTFAYSVQLFADNGFRPLWVRIWNKKQQALSTSSPYHLATTKPVGDAEYVGAFADANYKFVKRLSLEERREWGYTSVWNIVSVQGSASPKDTLDERNHHARFPVELPWRCIKMHSDKGNIVLEPFSGTFTTGVASEQSGRVCYAMEREPVYCDISAARYHKFAPDADVCLLRGGERISLEETGMRIC